LAKDKEPKQQQAVVNSDVVQEDYRPKETPSKGLRPWRFNST